MQLQSVSGCTCVLGPSTSCSSPTLIGSTLMEEFRIEHEESLERISEEYCGGRMFTAERVGCMRSPLIVPEGLRGC